MSERHGWIGEDGDKNVVSSLGELKFGNVAIESISTADIYEFALEILRLAAENKRLRELESRLEFFEECADAPLMATVLRERDEARRELAADHGWQVLEKVMRERDDLRGVETENLQLATERDKLILERNEAEEAIRKVYWDDTVADVHGMHWGQWFCLPAVVRALEGRSPGAEGGVR